MYPFVGGYGFEIISLEGPRLIESTLSGLLSDAKEGKNPFEGLTPEA